MSNFVILGNSFSYITAEVYMKNFYTRTIQIAQYMLQTKSTIRQTAKVFGMAKSTVHYDLQNRLKIFSPTLYDQIVELLEENFSQKSMRGGIATKQKYQQIKNKKY